jgi:hypothetical protein
MKQFITLVYGIFLALNGYSQAYRCCDILYLTDTFPFAVGDNMNDQYMFDLIEDLGWSVTAEQISPTINLNDYDVVFTSEAIGSGNAGWPTFSDAPMPMIMAKVWAIKASALGWITSENGGSDYGNLTDSVFIEVEDHPITSDLPNEIKICENSSESAIGAFVNATDFPSGASVVYCSKSDPDKHSVVALEQGTTLNGHTLENRAVILGIHQVVYDELNYDAVPRLIDNCLLWVIGMPGCGSGTTINNNDIINTTVYPNPSTGTINVKFNQYMSSALISITALDGKTIKTYEISNTGNTSLDLTNLTNGYYFISIFGENINYTQSISLQN